jgi:hypothetical protein
VNRCDASISDADLDARPGRCQDRVGHALGRLFRPPWATTEQGRSLAELMALLDLHIGDARERERERERERGRERGREREREPGRRCQTDFSG